MDKEQLLQQLRDLPLEEGCSFIQKHAAELADHAAFGVLIKDEALRQQNIAPFISLKLAELLIFFGNYFHHASSHALGLIAKGDALRNIGYHQVALEFLDAAGMEFLQLADMVGWARSRMGWILSAAWLGRTEEALQEAARAREVLQQHGEYARACMVDNNTAIIYIRLGRYQEALALYENLRAIYPTLTDQSETYIKRSVAMAESNQANNLFWLGRFQEAYHLMQQAQVSFEALEEPRFIIATEMNLADYDDAQGYYGSALRRYYQARDRIQQNNIDDPVLLAELKLRMTVCLVKLNRAEEACNLAAEAVETYRQIGQSLDTGAALCEYATALIASGRAEKALLALDEAWLLFEPGKFDHYAYTTRLQQAELLLETGAAAEAYQQATSIQGYFDTKGLVSQSVRASLVIVAALVETMQREKEQLSLPLQEALSLCKRAALQARRHNLQELVYKGQYLLGRIAILQDNPVKAAKHFKAAIIQVERILQDLVYDLSPSFLRSAWAVYADMITICLQQGQSERAFGFLEQARSMALRQYLNKLEVAQGKRDEAATTFQANSTTVLSIQRELKDWQQHYRNILLADITASSLSSSLNQEAVETELKQCEVKISELFERLQLHQLNVHLSPQTNKRPEQQLPQISIAQLRQYLAPDQLLLAYYLHEGKLVIFAISTEHFTVHENADAGVQLERLLPLLHAHLRPGGWPDPQQPPHYVIQRLLNKLYTILVAPVAALLPPSSGSLTIIPYGPLHTLPFHALHDGSHFLIEDFQINYLPTSSLLVHLSSRRNENTPQKADKEISASSPLVFGYSENGYLQWVQDEARTLASLLNGRCYLENDATISRLMALAPGSPIIHIATHGQNRQDAPTFSYLRLADGHLNTIDAFSLDLNGCELVTLSGCETGLSLSGGGDEQIGLGRAFLAAGVRSLVMSLWSVEDNATSELMQLFYRHLLRGDSRVQALRAAQCNLLYQKSSHYAHPYFWAAFRLVGDTGPLSAQQK